MNKDELKGKLQNIKGRMKDAAGSITGDKGTQALYLLLNPPAKA